MAQLWHRLRLPSVANLAVRRFASKPPPKQREIRFSETAAYQGVDRRNFNLGKSTWRPDYYSSDHYKYSKLISALSSIAIFVLWFGYLREPSDLDEILNAPPHLLSANLERRMLKDEIERAKKAGKNTALLEAELEYVEVKEAAMKVQFKK
uniref:Uncharacterized protein n=1 Tax=Panagrellus redivivus TaxID=6233 RepID=A0A7E4WD28_PANRE